ncbi:DUF2975 domain-containing protein [Psychroserpens algicola]|uniref:DUF2975 domain-containing protein n=1 Tax=Psychroserpens algicola TaxID=1719034 RepID=A0ABT0H5S8_9FLAO|nr:DUF2975 domain-containing protein [Psychroserpens algicola]MCK8479167.1 DUF2975 domain-containing protein [Psychroserpens algicola]
MKNNNLLVVVLHAFFTVFFWILIVLLCSSIVFEAFTDDGKIGKFSATYHHSKGYGIPVRVRVETPNAVYKNWINKNVDKNTKKVEYFHETTELSELEKKGLKNIVNIYFTNEEEAFTTNQHITHANDYLIVKSNSSSFLFIQLLKTYVGFISFVFIIYLLMKVFRELKRNLNFTTKLYKMINGVGLLIIFNTMIKLIISILISLKYDFISVETLLDNSFINDAVRFSINPRLEFEFKFFIIGLSLLVLAGLLKKGNQIKQDNELTI